MPIIKTIAQQTSLNDFLSNLYFSKKDIYRLITEKRIAVNGSVVKINCTLQRNDILSIDYHQDEDIDIKAIPGNLKICYEDDICLIIDKQPGLIIHDDSTGTITLDNYVADYYRSTEQKHKIYHVHRLDKDTSGLILYCKESLLVAMFEKMLERKEIQRTYLAIVEGLLRKELTINKKIGSDRHVNNKYRVSETGKDAITHIIPISYDGNRSTVKCILETGRTHQIRVHLSSINHPIVGDILYGGKAAERMMLHSCQITFRHPVSNETITIESALKKDIASSQKR